MYWVGVGVVWVLGIAVLVKASSEYAAVGSDFIQDYAAGAAFLRGEPIYGRSLTMLAYTLTGVTGHENFHPPFAAVLFSPLSLLDYQIAFTLWVLVNGLLLFVVAELLLRNLNLDSQLRYWYPLLLFWPPAIFAFGTGQSSILLVLLVFLTWAALRGRHPRVAGALLGLAALIKLFPAYLVLVFIARREWSAVGSFILVSLAGWIASVWVFGVKSVAIYWVEVAPRDIVEFGEFPLNVSIYSLIAPFFRKNHWIQPLLDAPELGYWLGMGASLAIALAGAWYILKFRSDADLASLFGVGIAAMILVNPISWGHFFPVLLLPWSLVWRESKESKLFRVLLLSAVLLCSFPTVEWARYLVEVSLPEPLSWWQHLLSKFGIYGVFLSGVLCGFSHKVTKNPEAASP